jgi:hypothetical protein
MNMLIGSIIGGASGLLIVYIWQLVSYKIWERKFKKQWNEDTLTVIDEIQEAYECGESVIENEINGVNNGESFEYLMMVEIGKKKMLQISSNNQRTQDENRRKNKVLR